MTRECFECRQCNRKGKPSVTKYSYYCDRNFIGIKKTVKSSLFRRFLDRMAIFDKIKDFMFNKRFDEKKGLNTKGFRDGFFK